jgi:polysaccharide deacetylase family protein (PEP-CTERM system associated)
MSSVTVDVSRPAGLLSVDVEDYFHVEAFTDRVDPQGWDTYPSRVDANTRRLLDLFDEFDAKGTFFILGWVAGRFPDLVAEIVRRGHEAACHSYWHRLVFNLSEPEFREDTRRAKDTIEQAAGVAIYGYRAPSFSITRKSMWAMEILAELGFRYDPDAPRKPFRIDTPAGPIAEFPLTTFRWLVEKNIPVGGGGYLRILPFWLTKLGARKAREEGLTIVSYVHPWEIDPDQPRIDGRLTSRLRHYTNLGETAARLRKLAQRINYSNFRDSGLVDATLNASDETETVLRA